MDFLCLRTFRVSEDIYNDKKIHSQVSLNSLSFYLKNYIKLVHSKTIHISHCV